VDAERRVASAQLEYERAQAEQSLHPDDKKLAAKVESAKKGVEEANRALRDAGGTPRGTSSSGTSPSKCTCDPRDPLCGC
jgi:hypothetical protein